MEKAKAKKGRNVKKQRALLEPVPAQANDGNSKFARALGSTDYVTREKGLQALSRWLTCKKDISELDMLKLWKGLFFCFWHSDKAPVQNDLAERLAALMPKMQPEMGHLYFSAFLAIMRREWFNMDHHRLNKFLMLTRKFVAQLMSLFKASGWDPALIIRYTQQLRYSPALLPSQEHRSAGLTYHLADLWLPELAKAAGEEPVPGPALQQLLEPFLLALAQASSPALVGRVREAVLEALLQQLTRSDHEGPEPYLQELDTRQLAEQLFAHASDPKVHARNREALYALHADLERVSGKRQKMDSKLKEQQRKVRDGQQQDQNQQEQQQQQEGVSADAPATKKKKKKKHSMPEQQNALAMEVDAAPTPDKKHSDQQQSVVGSPTTPAAAAVGAAAMEGLSSKKKKKRHKEREQNGSMNGVDAAGEQTPPAARADVGSAALSGKKRNKHTQAEGSFGKQQQQQQEEVNTPTAAAAGGVKPAAQVAVLKSALKKGGGIVSPKVPHSARSKLKGSKKAAAAGGPSPKTAAKPTMNGGPSPRAASTGKRRGVVINERKNLYFDYGSAPPEAEVRTPPKAQPKGSALKTPSRLGRSGPASAPPKMGAVTVRRGGGVAGRGRGGFSRAQPQPQQQVGGFGGRKAVTPSSVPRPKAAAFF